MTENIEREDRVFAWAGTILVHAALFLALLLIILHTPIPPYPESGGPGIEIDFGNYVEGTGTTEGMQSGNEEPESNTQKSETQPSKNTDVSEGNILTNDDETSVPMPKSQKANNEKKTTEPVKTVEKPKASNDLLNAIAAMKKGRGQKQGGDGNSGNDGNTGDPDGVPDGGKGGEGSGPEGPVKGPGWIVDLKGSYVVKRPDHDQFAGETGKVVVEIVVDVSGKVIEATPGVRGSTTTNSELKARARQAALSIKFNPKPDVKLRKGTMTFIFAY